VEVIVGVNYQTDLDQAIKLIKGLMQSDARIHSNPESVVLVREFSNSSIDLRILFWVDNRDNWPMVRSDLMRNIKRIFEENSIEIPYPQMVLHQPSIENGLPKEDEKHEG
jgi:small conductance mechanosensitive channel